MHATEAGGFAPDIEEEIRKIEWCDFMLWQHPLWWFGLPAILKGLGGPRSLPWEGLTAGAVSMKTVVFKGKAGHAVAHDGRPGGGVREGRFQRRHPRRAAPHPSGDSATSRAFNVLAPHIIFAPVRLRDDQRKDILEGYGRRLRQIEKEKPVDVGEY